MKGLNPRHHLLPFCPEAECFHQNRKFNPHNSIDVIASTPAYGNHIPSKAISNECLLVAWDRIMICINNHCVFLILAEVLRLLLRKQVFDKGCSTWR